MTSGQLRIGADVGGTFTDVVFMDEAGNVRTHKVLSTPPNFEQAVLNGISTLLEGAGGSPSDADGPRGNGAASPTISSGETKAGSITAVCHGTTVATNAVLEHRGAKTALVTTRGFRDVLEIRRVRAPQIYDLFFEKPKVLVERRLRFELTERVTATGEVLAPVAENELAVIAARLRAEGVESVAVCLLHSYAFPAHEQQVGRALRGRLPGVPVSLSCEVVRELREYERTATTAVNAYVRPVMERYLADL